jgi:hypothetical protein
MIALMVARMTQNMEQVTTTQSNALDVMTRQVQSEKELIMMALGATMAGAISIQEQLVGRKEHPPSYTN